jgi:hypothetical protein
MGVVTGLHLVDIIPLSDSSETADNSEPSVAVDPLNTNEIVAGAFGVFSGGTATNPYFTSIDGGTAWTDYGDLAHNEEWGEAETPRFSAAFPAV